MRRNFLILVIVLFAAVAQAVTIEQPLADAAKEAQAHALFETLKCVVCEGQSLADSDAKLAVQMRALIRAKLQHGESPKAIIRFFEGRYGEHILLRPPMTMHTFLLWGMPLIALVFGFLMVRRFTREAV